MDKAQAEDIYAVAISMLTAALTSISGWDADKTQILKNDGGTLTWVEDA